MSPEQNPYEPPKTGEAENTAAKNPSADDAGGCASGCAIFFILILLWPLFSVLNRTYKSDDLFILLLFGGPSFIMAHLLAFISIARHPPGTSRGGRTLEVLWTTIGVAIAVLLIAGIFVK